MPEALETWPVTPVRGGPAAPPADHLRDQLPLPAGGDAPLPGRRGPPAAHVHRGRGRRPAAAHGAPRDRRQPQRERRFADPHGPDEEDHLRGLRRVLPGQDHQYHERGHAAPLAARGQPGPVLAHHRRTSARTGSATSTQLRKLAPLAEDAAFRREFRAFKRINKERLAEIIKMRLQIAVNPASLFDVQIKRIHEYKRQLLNVLHIVTRYNRIREGQTETHGSPHDYLLGKGRARLRHGQADHQADPQRSATW